MDNIVKLDILAHADFAGCLKKTRRNPGLGAYSSEIAKVRQTNPEGTLLLDAGDEYCNNYWGGKGVVEALELIGTDALTLGNHEFDRGKGFLEECVSYASYPILCANIIDKGTGELPKGVLPYTIIEKAGVKIGILGLTTEYTPYMVIKGAFDDHQVLSAIERADHFIPQMRQEGAQIIIVLSHFPFYFDDSKAISGELADVLEKIPPVEVFIGGHIPGDYAEKVGNTVVLKAGFGGGSLAHCQLWFDKEKAEVIKSESGIIITDNQAKGSEAVEKYVATVVSPFDDYFNEVLATTDKKWTMSYSHESDLGNFLADCLLDSMGAEIGYMNTTSAGGSIYPGAVTVEDLTSVYGFDDEILTAEMRGESIYQLFEQVYAPERFGNNAALMFSGIIVHIDHDQKTGNKVQKITLRDGTPLDKEKLYKVASSEYMGLGGNDTEAIVKDYHWVYSGIPFYDAMFAYVRKYGKFDRFPEQRLYEKGSPENDNSPKDGE